ncbi:hypothetical protein [Chryseobacterium sp.]|uniref:hypothetical protein n=1 Tax=Chryseobacterium sp. TaxID=1871047 RepID=UPI0025C2ACF6|nr:hypothetical protein [Chryseobacterium sp.]MBV8325971.1 hypothetical protein [Chryseobacterium sp.]
MNPRVLELIKNPKNIQSEDLGLLKEEIHAFPYIQNIRALHLYGVHLYDQGNYQKELSTTAAYTTDKKILYQLINGIIQKSPKQEFAEEKQILKNADKASRYGYKDKGFPLRRDESPVKEEEKENISCVVETPQEVKHLYINGERNRILFEGEENFLDEENQEKIDIESTMESGVLVTQTTAPVLGDAEKEEVKDENAGEDFTPETIIDEDKISSEAEVREVEQEAELSFHETEALLPEVTIEEEAQEIKETAESDAILDSVEENNIEQPDAELSFHGTDAFLPDVKIQTHNTEEVTPETPEGTQSNVNKHEDEMRRLIEEVEKKMKEAKTVPQEIKEEPEPVSDAEISFAETQSFHFWSTEKEEPVKAEEAETNSTEGISELSDPVKDEATGESAEEEKEAVSEVQSSWKPMSVETNVPDSLISKSVQTSDPQKDAAVHQKLPVAAKTEEKDENKTEDTTEKMTSEPEGISEPVESENTENIKDETEGVKDEVPVMNVSFFGTDISSLRVEEKEKEKSIQVKESQASVKESAQQVLDSNVPGFINTWQSWLKIDRTEEVEKDKVENKEKVIDSFIENNPKISQLKEESTYVVKEKNDDISHLMTETLANLYFEQKLYTKAVKAFEILIRKTPEKKEYFESKIQEIKDFRSKN